MDIDQVATVRRSLLRPPPPPQQQKPLSERARRGWLAHQSVFPPSSSSEDEEESDESEANSVIGDMDEINGYQLSLSELAKINIGQQAVAVHSLEEPLLGPDELDQERTGGMKVPVRLQVYHGRFGHWEREGLRKYKGRSGISFWPC